MEVVVEVEQRECWNGLSRIQHAGPARMDSWSNGEQDLFGIACRPPSQPPREINFTQLDPSTLTIDRRPARLLSPSAREASGRIGTEKPSVDRQWSVPSGYGRGAPPCTTRKTRYSEYMYARDLATC